MGESVGESVGVAVAQGEGAEVDDVATGVCFPAAVGTLEAHCKQTLAGGLDVAGADGEAEPSRHLIPHVLAVILKFRDGLLHGATVPDAHGLLLAVPKCLQNLLDRVVFTQQTQQAQCTDRQCRPAASSHIARYRATFPSHHAPSQSLHTPCETRAAQSVWEPSFSDFFRAPFRDSFSGLLFGTPFRLLTQLFHRNADPIQRHADGVRSVGNLYLLDQDMLHLFALLSVSLAARFLG